MMIVQSEAPDEPVPLHRDHPSNWKLTGFRHFVAAGGYSAGGAARVWKEAAFRQELGAFCATLVLYVCMGTDIAVMVGALVLFLALIAMEALNTAIEEIIDRVSPEYSATARHAKDLGSFAVFCLLSANGVLFFYAVADHIFV
jgi:diacylglycerol kinase (ATP)